MAACRGSDQQPDRRGGGQDRQRPQHDLAAVVRGDDDEALEEREQRLVVQLDLPPEGVEDGRCVDEVADSCGAVEAQATI